MAKLTILIFITTVLALPVFAQQRSYEQEEIIKQSGVFSENDINSLSSDQKQITRIYKDGLGRIIQSISVQYSPGHKDIIKPVVFDQVGRLAKNYLPYVSSTDNGDYHLNAISEQNNFYNNGLSDKVADDSAPYATQIFDNSPLQRILRSGSLGKDFQPQSVHDKKMNYRPNTVADNVFRWMPNGQRDGSYLAGLLTVSEGTDEQGNQTLIFKDDNNHMVLKRQLANETVNGNLRTYFDTYYLYNFAGLLSYIIPPKAVISMNNAGNWNPEQAGIDKLTFRYFYDEKGRLIEKYVPSSSVMYIVYDPLDRPVLIQDGNLRNQNKWNYIKYDVQNRPVIQGIYIDGSNVGRNSMQNYVNSLNYNVNYFEVRSGDINTGYYTNNVFPVSNTEALAFSYFNDYDLNNDGNADFQYQAQGLADEPSASNFTRDLLTVVRKRTIGSGLANAWIVDVLFYDKNSRLIQNLSNNQINQSVNDSKTNVLDFGGKTIQNKTVKVVNGTTTAVLSTFTYDHADRLLAIDQNYNNSPTPIRIAAYLYNELGQMVKKNIHVLGGSASGTNIILGAAESVGAGQQRTTIASNSITLSNGFYAAQGSVFRASIAANCLQSVDYRYNIRGQITSINNSSLKADNLNDDDNDLFGMELFYDQTDQALANTPYYNGQLSAVKWRSKTPQQANPQERAYLYGYDKLNRIKYASFKDRTGTAAWANSGLFNENNISYDENGNILSLKRNAEINGAIMEIDNLTYSYDGNRLNNVVDAANNTLGFKNETNAQGVYSYDSNGNLQTDPKKNLTLDCNVLNRTQKITINNAAGRYITYTYAATGIVLRKQAYDNNTLQKTTDYIDGFVYENNTLAYFTTAEGRVRNVSGTLKNEYMLKDNQGNVRVSFEDNGGVAKVIQENSYYAFGMVMPGSVVPTQPNNNLYNGGAEWQNDFGNLPDYYQTFYRNYDAALGRWINVDPKAEIDNDQTVYQYAGNNPVMFNDPLGDVSQAVWEAALTELENNSSSSYGGSFSDNAITYYDSQSSAIAGGASQLSMTDGWGSQPGWATSYQNALDRYNTATRSSLSYDRSGYAVMGVFYKDANGKPMLVNGLSGSAQAVIVDGHSKNYGLLGTNVGQYDASFKAGFLNATESNHNSLSSTIGYVGTMTGKNEYLLKYAAGSVKSYSSAKAYLSSAKMLKATGRYVGYASSFIKTYESLADGRVTAGEVIGIGLSVASIYFPVYGLVDLGVEIATGTSISDRISSGIDSALPDEYYKF